METPAVCAFFGFATKYNLTVLNHLNNQEFVKMFRIPYFFPETKLYPKGFGTFEYERTIQMIFFDLQTEPNTFIVVLDSNEVQKANRNALFTSMDKSTWFMTLSSLILLSLGLYYLNIIEKEKNVFVVGILLFGTLINQGMRLPNITFPLLLTFGICSSVTIVIANGYAGLFLSLLTKPTIPVVPNDISGVLRSQLNFQFLTFGTQLSASHTQSFKLESQSSFRGDVLQYKYAQNENRKECLVCDGVVQKLIYLKPLRNGPEIYNIVLALLAMKNPGQYASQSYNESSKSLVFLDDTFRVKLVEEALRL